MYKEVIDTEDEGLRECTREVTADRHCNSDKQVFIN